jgi:hypothetical protein
MTAVVDPGAALVVVTVLVSVVVTGSLHPNHPGVLQVDDDVEVELLVTVVVVLSSKHPHHPGVLHVSVRARVVVDELELDIVVVVPVWLDW